MTPPPLLPLEFFDEDFEDELPLLLRDEDKEDESFPDEELYAFELALSSGSYSVSCTGRRTCSSS